MNIFDNDLDRLNFEDIIWYIFIGISILNIIGDKFLKEFIISKDKNKEKEANYLFLIIIIITILIYIYFFIRNYNAYIKCSEEEKEIYLVKLFGSVFFVVGGVCLLYFQVNNSDFIGTVI